VVAKGAPPTDPRMVEATLKLNVREMRGRHRQGCRCLRRDRQIAKAIKLDVEQLIYETKEFLNAASLINRISKN